MKKVKVNKRTLTTSAMPFENSRTGRVSRNAASMKMYSGCQNTPMRFLPCSVSIVVFPPMLESTIASRVVGICTKRMLCMLPVSINRSMSVSPHAQQTNEGEEEQKRTHKVVATKPTRSPSARITVSCVHLFSTSIKGAADSSSMEQSDMLGSESLEDEFKTVGDRAQRFDEE